MATTTNYGWTTPDDTALVKDGASAIRSLGSAIDSTVYSKLGLVHINTTSFSAVSSFSLAQDTFTSTYDNYKLIISGTASASDELYVRMRLAGTDNTASSYEHQWIEAQSTTLLGNRSTTTAGRIGVFGSSERQAINIEIYAPKLAVYTCLRGSSVNTDAANTFLRENNVRHKVATAYDSLSIIHGSGTMTGSYSIYGYKK